MSDDEIDKWAEHIHKLAIALNEHCDSVRIITTVRARDGGTAIVTKGAGNWFAQLGSVNDWLARSDENTRTDERKSHNDDGDLV